MIEAIEVDPEMWPYRNITRSQWSSIYNDRALARGLTGFTLPRSISDDISISEINDIYLPLSELLTFYVSARQGLSDTIRQFLNTNDDPTPFIIGISGSVAAGKSAIAHVMKALLPQWPGISNVDLIATDGFLYPNRTLQTMGIMDRKGFPESYDSAALRRFIARAKAGEAPLKAPVYSHLSYDIIPDEAHIIDRLDVLIIEGLNTIDSHKLDGDIPLLSDFVDFSIYVHASESDLEKWYVARFLKLRKAAIQDASCHFHKFANLSDKEARQVAKSMWTNINLRNLRENILPNKHRADLILNKGPSHAIENISFRKL